MSYEEIVMQIIVSAGNSRSLAMEAIASAKKGDGKSSRECLARAEEELLDAHKIQTNLIQEEALGNRIEMSLLMVHAQDHLMNAITVKDLAKEFIDLYEKVNK